MVSTYKVAMLVFDSEEAISFDTADKIKKICDVFDCVISEYPNVTFESRVIDEVIHLSLRIPEDVSSIVLREKEQLEKIADACNTVSIHGFVDDGFVIDITV